MMDSSPFHSSKDMRISYYCVNVVNVVIVVIVVVVVIVVSVGRNNNINYIVLENYIKYSASR